MLNNRLLFGENFKFNPPVLSSSLGSVIRGNWLTISISLRYQQVFGYASPHQVIHHGPGPVPGQTLIDSQAPILIAADAIQRAGGADAEKIVDALEKTSLLVTRGTVQFGTQKGGSEYHHWMPPMLVIQWQNKEQVVLYPPEGATGQLKR